MKLDTKCVRFEAAPGDPWRPVSTPIYQTATFAQSSAEANDVYDYTRSGNPTRTDLERQLAALEGGACALAWSSGMAAVAAVLRLADRRRRIVVGDDLYGGTWRLLADLAASRDLGVEAVDATDAGAVDAALGRGADLLLVESPSNPLQRVADLEALARSARRHGAVFAVDNSMLSPARQRPLAAGADLVLHSATKFLGGHADVTAGAVIARDRALADRLAFLQNAEGTALGPFDAWLLLRGMKTLALRVDRQERTARLVARHLASMPGIVRVHYAGLESHPGFEVQSRQAAGPGALIAFETASLERSRRFVEALRLFTLSVSFGSVASTANMPCRSSHAAIPADVRASRGLAEDLVRLSIGIEDPEDLLADLDSAARAALSGSG